jgi:hypothetical protein
VPRPFFGGSLLLATVFLSAVPAIAAETPTPSETAEAAKPGVEQQPDLTQLVLPANTVIELEVVDFVGSNTNKPGDFFHLRLAKDVMLGSVVLIPAGTSAIGQVVHATKSGTGGKGGELILAARYIDAPQGQIKLRSSFGAAGKDRTKTAIGMTIAVGALGMLVKGKQVELPAGSPISARIAVDTYFPGTGVEPTSATL